MKARGAGEELHYRRLKLFGTCFWRKIMDNATITHPKQVLAHLFPKGNPLLSIENRCRIGVDWVLGGRRRPPGDG